MNEIKDTSARWPPMVTVTGTRVEAKGCEGLAKPDGGWFVTGPKPFAYNTYVPPRRTAFAVEMI